MFRVIFASIGLLSINYFRFDKARLGFLRCCFVAGLALLSTAALAQTERNKVEGKRLQAVNAVISMLLLDSKEPPIERPDGRGVLLSLGQDLGGRIDVSRSDKRFIEFESFTQTAEICFFIASSNGARRGDFQIKLNGDLVTARLGENCFVLNPSQQRDINYVEIEVSNPGITINLSQVGLQPTRQSYLGLPRLSRTQWNNRAVRKVLKVFAYGGHATDRQINTWADMQPETAIKEMLHFRRHNRKLSPFVAGERYTEIASQDGRLNTFLDYLSSKTSHLPTVADDKRSWFAINGPLMSDGFSRMAVVRGLNPFRHRIGYMETNYHMAVNLSVGVEKDQTVRYYDSIMDAHESGIPYKDVIGVAAKSAAIAMQYRHRLNLWNERTNKCSCNADFAREIHQLFYGIYGTNDPNHEDVTIPETAKMLTGMRVRQVHGVGFDNDVNFTVDGHHTDDVQIFGHSIGGATAREKIDNLMPLSMQHPESLHNLPVWIIQWLADDNLSDYSKRLLRRSWAALGVDRRLLDYIQAYAISGLFHGPTQRKYMTTYERTLYIANRSNTDNVEAIYSGDDGVGKTIRLAIQDENSGAPFRPLHNVFGAQTSREAVDSALSFEKQYNFSAAPSRDKFINRYHRVNCNSCDAGQPWNKDWANIIPRPSGGYKAEYVARWLWNHMIGNLDNYGALERAHLLAIIGANPSSPIQSFQYMDLNFLLCLRADRLDNGETDNSLATLMHHRVWRQHEPGGYCRHGDDGHQDYSPAEKAAFNLQLSDKDVQNLPHVKALVDELAVSALPLDSNDPVARLRANERVQSALAFIMATPFIFAEGR